jgi:ABC-type polysaccharide/polyol phosphate transport system ATPase subunit
MARVVLDGVRIDFPIYGTRKRTLRDTIYERATGGLIQHQGSKNKNNGVLVQALTDISLELNEGDRLGLIGHNGSGKSTLLKAIAGIYEPVQGSLLVEGRVTPLFDRMPGVEMEDTGYENIITAGMLLGMSRAEIDGKIPEIAAFCELGEYLSLPMRTYSTGMIARLGFAVATSISPDVLLLDEGLGAGDLSFAEKVAQRMEEFIGRSRILVLASHSEELMTSICNKAALLQKGRLISIGPVKQTMELYQSIVHGTSVDPSKIAEA